MYLSSNERPLSEPIGRSTSDTATISPGRPSTATLSSTAPAANGSTIAWRSSSNASSSASRSSSSPPQRATPIDDPSVTGLTTASPVKRSCARRRTASGSASHSARSIRSWSSTSMPAAFATSLARCLSMPTAAAATPRPAYGHLGQLERPQQRAVLPAGAVDRVDHDVDVHVRGLAEAAGGGLHERGRAADPQLDRPPARGRLGGEGGDVPERLAGPQPAVRRQVQRRHLVALAEDGHQLLRGDDRDVVLDRRAAEEDANALAHGGGS